MISRQLNKGLVTSFIDGSYNSEEIYQTKLVQNDYPLEKVIHTFETELESCTEFWFTTAFLSMSGFCTLYSMLEDLERRKIPGRILVSQYLNFTQPDALNRLKQYSNLEVRIETASDLHAKTYLFKHENHLSVLIGSSNLTANALTKNQEHNIFIKALAESKIIQDIFIKKKTLFESAQDLTEDYLSHYAEVYQTNRRFTAIPKFHNNKLLGLAKPNLMQKEALNNLALLREQHVSKALLISATGTGKTYLSAFDVRNFKAKSMLFIVHRENILLDAQKTFAQVFGSDFQSCIFSGSNQNIDGHKFIFATIQSLSREHHLTRFDPNDFEYIVIDESHRSGSPSYLKIFEYFKPKFLLGMTATPERSDGFDIFKAFDHNIAYEIRLKEAMKSDLICPFHYFGISDLEINGQSVDNHSDFKYLTSDERVNSIKDASLKFGTDNGELRALIFCSNVKECNELAYKMSIQGIKSIPLVGEHSTEQRTKAIESISSDEPDRIKMIFTVDIFNEGIDIPKINQIIFLRATESSIVYIQQLGRGLRKSDDKEYLTVIDFIGNYEKNFLIPMALFGDSSFNKDQLRRLVKNGSSILPGASTIHFDEVAKEKIFASINSSNFQTKKDLVQAYKNIQKRIGRIPMMMDFVNANVRDPFTYVSYSKSFYSFVKTIDADNLQPPLTELQECVLQFLSSEINNAKRILESLILLKIIQSEQGDFEIDEFKKLLVKEYSVKLSADDIDSIMNNINFKFNPTKHFKDNQSIALIAKSETYFEATDDLKAMLENDTFKTFLQDNCLYSIDVYTKKIEEHSVKHGFIYSSKYSRKDVFRILNWENNPIPQNVGGYLASKDKSNCPIFVTYHKADDISDSTKYEDKFIDPQHFQWMSKSKRKITSPDVQLILNAKSSDTLLPLFVKKDNDEGLDFYFIGFLTYIENTAHETKMQTETGQVSVVQMNFRIDKPVENSLYKYLVGL